MLGLAGGGSLMDDHGLPCLVYRWECWELADHFLTSFIWMQFWRMGTVCMKGVKKIAKEMKLIFWRGDWKDAGEIRDILWVLEVITILVACHKMRQAVSTYNLSSPNFQIHSLCTLP